MNTDRSPYALEFFPREDGDFGLVLYEVPESVYNPDKNEMVVRVWGLPFAVSANRIIKELKDRKLELIEVGDRKRFLLDKPTGQLFGLLIFAIKPLRSEKRVQLVMEGVLNMEEEEVAYWFSKCTQKKIQKQARRALRILLAGDTT